MTGIALFLKQGKQIYSVVQTHCKKNPEMHHGKVSKSLKHCFVCVLLTVRLGSRALFCMCSVDCLSR